ncbi:hypothetical protein M501DRAFT_1002236 [Patellaria atrata CBS 101060]|uniref:Uncharacterized protein n=1 Tax=Patellaria atrata CBS 101060 TaxID=1346257 RepID=A0A9P4S0J9_9PEZI|nr:hypothetical protein M501DRAFT_1002236 [Patellaria atrata CBS 101060]
MEQQRQLEQEFQDWEPIEPEPNTDASEEQQLNLAPRAEDCLAFRWMQCKEGDCLYYKQQRATAKFRDRDPTHIHLPESECQVKGCKTHEGETKTLEKNRGLEPPVGDCGKYDSFNCTDKLRCRRHYWALIHAECVAATWYYRGLEEEFYKGKVFPWETEALRDERETIEQATRCDAIDFGQCAIKGMWCDYYTAQRWRAGIKSNPSHNAVIKRECRELECEEHRKGPYYDRHDRLHWTVCVESGCPVHGYAKNY